MLRIFGAICIIIGCTGLGVKYCFHLKESLSHLRCMRQILYLFASEIQYGKSTLPECCKLIANKVKHPYRDALQKIYLAQRKEDKECFFLCWKYYMENALSDIPLKTEEKNVFLTFCESTDYVDYRMQLKTLEQYQDMLSNYIKNREDNLEKQKRLTTGLAVCCGLLIAVILI